MCRDKKVSEGRISPGFSALTPNLSCFSLVDWVADQQVLGFNPETVRMKPTQPYSGDLVYSDFKGSFNSAVFRGSSEKTERMVVFLKVRLI